MMTNEQRKKVYSALHTAKYYSEQIEQSQPVQLQIIKAALDAVVTNFEPLLQDAEAAAEFRKAIITFCFKEPA